MGTLSMRETDSVWSCFQVYPQRSNRVKSACPRRGNPRFKRLRLRMCGIYGGRLSRARAASKCPRKHIMATKPVVDDFGVAHLVLRVISLADGFQNVGTQAIHRSDLFSHGDLVFQGGRLPSPWRKSPMGVNRSPLGLIKNFSAKFHVPFILICQYRGSLQGMHTLSATASGGGGSQSAKRQTPTIAAYSGAHRRAAWVSCTAG
jgi:hypothetical protein